MAHLIVSDGVTAMIASIIPAPRPANIDRGAESFPCPSARLLTPCVTHILVLKQRLELIIRCEAHTGLGSIADDDGGAAGVKALDSSLGERPLHGGNQARLLRVSHAPI